MGLGSEMRDMRTSETTIWVIINYLSMWLELKRLPNLRSLCDSPSMDLVAVIDQTQLDSDFGSIFLLEDIRKMGQIIQ